MIETELSTRPHPYPKWSAWELLFLALLSASILVTVYIASTRLYLGFDDLVTAVVVSEPSLVRMLKAIGGGVEVNPPLFFILEWVVVRLAGTGDFALRVLSGVSLATAIPILYATIRRAAPPQAATLAVAFIFGLSRDVYEFSVWARYYAWLILLTAIAAYFFMRFYIDSNMRKRDYAYVFLVHSAIVYTHLFGFFFSGALLAAHLVLDYGNRTIRWRLYATIALAWMSFVPWAPALRNQLSVTKDGTYTPRLDVGMFFDALGMQTPLAVVLLLIALLALLKWFSAEPPTAHVDHRPIWTKYVSVLLVLGLAWMSVAIVTWAGSHITQPFFMRRYVAPCINAWVFVAAAILTAICAVPKRIETGLLLPRWCFQLAWLAVLAFCILWQPLRAWTEPSKGAPFVDADYGHTSLPIVFENAMDFLPRHVYGGGREYVLVLDKEAAAADPGYYTKLTENMFSRWRSSFPHIRILYYDDLPAWPNGYLAVDHELAKTFDWLFQKSEIKAEMLGPWGTGAKVYKVQPGAR